MLTEASSYRDREEKREMEQRANDEKKGQTTTLQKSYFDVLGLCCSSEVHLIEKILKPLQGVKDVSVSVPTRTVIVLHDTLLISQLQIVSALNKARLEANVRVYGKKRNYEKRWPSPYAIASGLLLLLSFLKYIYHPFQWLALGAVAVGIFPVLFKALVALRNFTLDINILMIIAVGGSIALKDYWEAGTIVFLFITAEWLESRASHKATAVMESLVNIVPQTAVIAETGEEINADQVKLNTVVAVKPGNVIPIDGLVVQGKCDVDEKTLTGESFPVSKQINSTVWAGTINLNGYISVQTTALAEDCVVARMANLVEEAQNNKSKTQRFIDKCSKYYTPIIFALSAGLAIIPGAILRVENANEWYHLALVVLVGACPCALILSTPVATFCALSNAATSGLLVKGGEYLETLAKVKIMAFDKTGTITKGEFVVSYFKSLLEDQDDVTFNRLLYWISSIESKSSHPMAAALIEYAQSYSIEPNPDQVQEFHNFPGEGICGKIDGKDIYVGNRKIAARAGCSTIPTVEGDAKEGKSIGYIFLGSSPAGIFSLSDVCRTGAKEAIQELKSMGIKTAMLTGDCQEAAKQAQDQLGGALEVVHAELLPEDKARIIKEYQKESPTAMIGDGLNDAAALATADIGISMGISGSALAMETGNIILLSNDIRKIPQAARLAKRTRRKIFENMFLSVVTKGGIIGLAIAGHPLIWAAVLADVGTCLLVIFNSMLLLGGKGSARNSGTGHIHHKHGSKSDNGNCCSGKKKTEEKPQKCCSKKCAPQCDSEPLSSKLRDECCGSTTNKCTAGPTIGEDHGCCGHSDKFPEGNQNVMVNSRSTTAHIHQHCCTTDTNEAENCKSCIPQKSLLDNSGETHGCCEHDKVKEEKHVDHHHGSTSSDIVHSLSSHCSADNCVYSLEKGLGHCLTNEFDHETEHCAEIDEAKHCEHGSSSTKNDRHVEKSHHHHHHFHQNCEGILEAQHCEHGSSSTINDGHHVEKSHHHHNSHQNAEGIHEAKHCGHGSSSTANDHGVEKSHHHHHFHQNCDEIHEAKHCGHGSSSTINDHDVEESNHHHQHHHHDHHLDHHHSVGCTELIGHLNHHHCSGGNEEHMMRKYITEEELSNIVKTCCSGHGTSNHVECTSALEMTTRHIAGGGCCKSFRKECCGSPHQVGLGGNFGGGALSEIVIE